MLRGAHSPCPDHPCPSCSLPSHPDVGLVSRIRPRPGGAEVGETTGVGAVCSSRIWPVPTPTRVFGWGPGEPQTACGCLHLGLQWQGPLVDTPGQADWPSTPGHPWGPQFLCQARIGSLESPSPWGCPPAPTLDRAGVKWCCRVGGGVQPEPGLDEGVSASIWRPGGRTRLGPREGTGHQARVGCGSLSPGHVTKPFCDSCP